VSGQSCGHSERGVEKYRPKQIAARARTAVAMKKYFSTLDRRKLPNLAESPSPSGRGCEARARQGEASKNAEGLRICIDLRPSPAALRASASPRGRGRDIILARKQASSKNHATNDKNRTVPTATKTAVCFSSQNLRRSPNAIAPFTARFPVATHSI